MHSVWASSICRVRSQKALCLQLNVLVLNSVFSPLEKSLSGWSLVFFNGTKGHFCFGHRRGALGYLLLLKPCSGPAGEMQVNQPMWPAWALVSWKLALVCLYFYRLFFWAGGIAFQHEIKPWQPDVKHDSQEFGYMACSAGWRSRCFSMGMELSVSTGTIFACTTPINIF